MPHIGPTNRKDLIKGLRKLGFEGPLSGGKHQFMIKGTLTLRIPNPHKGDISLDLLVRILKQAEIDKKTWRAL